MCRLTTMLVEYTATSLLSRFIFTHTKIEFQLNERDKKMKRFFGFKRFWRKIAHTFEALAMDSNFNLKTLTNMRGSITV